MEGAPNESEIVDEVEKARQMAEASDLNRVLEVNARAKGNENAANMNAENAEAQEIAAGVMHEMQNSLNIPLEGMKEIEALVNKWSKEGSRRVSE